MQPTIEPCPGTYQNWSGVVNDPWFSLRYKDQAVAAIEAEDSWYAQSKAANHEVAEAIATEALEKINSEPTTSYPQRSGPWILYTTTDPSLQYPLHWAAPFETSKESILTGDRSDSWVTLDENAAAAAADGNGWDVGALEVTENGVTLYTFCADGSEIYSLARIDNRNAEPATILKTNISTPVVVLSENCFLTVSLDDQLRPFQVNLHTGSATTELFREEDQEYFVHIDKDRGQVTVTSGGHSQSRYLVWESWQLLSGHTTPDVTSELTQDVHRSFVPFPFTHIEIVDKQDGTNYLNYEGRCVYTAEPGTQITEVAATPGGMYLCIRGGGAIKLLLVTTDGATQPVDLPSGEDAYIHHVDQITSQAYVHSESWLGAGSVYRLSGTSAVRVKTDVVHNHDPKNYSYQRHLVTVSDATSVPVTVVRRADTAPGGPAIAYVYGAYGISLDAWFSATRVSALDRGVSFVVIHARGGGENGRAWHAAGRAGTKANTFNDVKDCISALYKQGEIGSVVLRGGSAGGGTVLAAANLDLGEALVGVVADVPFVDVLNTMSDADLPLTVGEYPEWGNPNTPQGYEDIAAWSPIDNIAKRPYPAFFVSVGVNDPRVGYWEGLKLAAHLRAADSHNLVYVRISKGAGHQGVSGIEDSVKEESETWAWMLSQLTSAL